MLSESTFAQFNFELQGHIGALGNADDQGASDIPVLSILKEQHGLHLKSGRRRGKKGDHRERGQLLPSYHDWSHGSKMFNDEENEMKAIRRAGLRGVQCEGDRGRKLQTA